MAERLWQIFEEELSLFEVDFIFEAWYFNKYHGNNYQMYVRISKIAYTSNNGV